ncbi:MAG TPA: circularly permuted type 2 ATP-grasp protein [Myxococcota bacterium]|nr:circularly permuted type 2 ATP-grasp protein [Myxococcota bacterium]
MVASGAIYDGEPLCVHRRPHFVDEALVKRVTRALGLLHRAIRKLKNAIIEEGLDGRPASLADRMGITPAALELARIEPGYRSAATIARVDCFVDGDVPRFLELNAESPAGIGYADALSAVFARDPLMRSMAATSLSSAPHLVRAVQEVWKEFGGSGPPLIAIVDFRDVPTRWEFELLRQTFRASGVRCEIADPRDLDFVGGRLFLRGEVVGLVYRRLLVSDILARPDECKALMDAYRAGAICMVNSLRTVLLHSKGLFALLHDPEFQSQLSASERRMIVEHVPWTTHVTDDEELLAMAIEDRQQLVLKPLVGHGGAGVVLGWQSAEADWVEALESATGHILQRRVPHQLVAFPDARDGYALKERAVDLDPFLIRGRFAGFLCRLATGPLANVSTGASQVPVFVT